MTVNDKTTVKTQAAFLCFLYVLYTQPASLAQDKSGVDAQPTAAVCPIVYPDDQAPSARGYHYTFFGNAFFINDQGYLLTVAHVLDSFRDGGQVHILVNRPNSPPRLLQATIIAVDAQHDVAILRATPNPFAGKYSVAFLPLAPSLVSRGQAVLAISLHPARLRDAHSFESSREDFSTGSVLAYESTQLEKFGPASDVFLLSHPVVRGQSGSPVLALDSHAVVGLVEGRWLRSTPLSLDPSARESASIPGAAIPIHYATDLLERHGVFWNSVPRVGPSLLPPAPPAK
jgi:S1-C subfamily serine protease